MILEDDSDPALDILEAGSGRGVLLPVKEIKSSKYQLQTLKKDDDVYGKAVDLVGYPPDYQVAIDLLLGGVIVVKDRIAARRILQNQPAGVRAVTLKGDVFHSSGPIRTGIPEGDGDHTLLGRARKRRQNLQALDRLGEKIHSNEAQILGLRNEYKSMLSEGLMLEQKWDEARKSFLNIGRILDQTRGVFEQAQRHFEWSRLQLEQLVKDSGLRKNEIEKFNEELLKLEQRLLHEKAVIKHKSDELDQLGIEELQTQHSHWATRLAVAQQAVNNARSRIVERMQALERARQSISVLKERIKSIDVEMKDVEKERANAHVTEEELGKEINILNSKISPVEADINELEMRQEVFQRETNSHRQAVSLAEQLHAQTRINLARRQESLQSLQRRIEDDFGLVNFEYVSQISGPTPLPFMGLVEDLPMVRKLPPDIEENIKRQRAQLRRIGPVNPEAQSEYEEVYQRYDFMIEQVADLQKAEQDIRQVIAELDILMRREFQRTFEAVASEFKQIFTRLFGGGTARLILTDPEDLSNTGIDIEARLPGRRTQGLALLSGGERSLTATSLVFALLRVSPTPFCVLDEVDAMLDEGKRRTISRTAAGTQQSNSVCNRNPQSQHCSGSRCNLWGDDGNRFLKSGAQFKVR